MNKYQLQSSLKTTTKAYLYAFFLAAHYAYLGKWGKQFLFWLTLGGLGVWGFIDLFTMSSKVERHNMVIYNKLDELDKRERENERKDMSEMLKASKAV